MDGDCDEILFPELFLNFRNNEVTKINGSDNIGNFNCTKNYLVIHYGSFYQKKLSKKTVTLKYIYINNECENIFNKFIKSIK